MLSGGLWEDFGVRDGGRWLSAAGAGASPGGRAGLWRDQSRFLGPAGRGSEVPGGA